MTAILEELPYLFTGLAQIGWTMWATIPFLLSIIQINPISTQGMLSLHSE